MNNQEAIEQGKEILKGYGEAMFSQTNAKLKKCKEALQHLISLAEQVERAGDGLPEKYYHIGDAIIDGWIDCFNKRIDACQIAFAKKDLQIQGLTKKCIKKSSNFIVRFGGRKYGTIQAMAEEIKQRLINDAEIKNVIIEIFPTEEVTKLSLAIAKLPNCELIPHDRFECPAIFSFTKLLIENKRLQEELKDYETSHCKRYDEMSEQLARVDVEKLERFITQVSEEKYYGKMFTFNYMVDVLAQAIVTHIKGKE